MSSSAGRRARPAVHRVGAVRRRQDDAGRAAGRADAAASGCRGLTRRAPRATGETDGVDYNFVTRRAVRGDGRRRRVSGVGRRLRQPLRHLRGGHRAHARRRATTSCSSSTCRARARCGRAASRPRTVFVMPPSFAVLEQRLRGRSKDSEDGDPAAAAGGAGRGRRVRRVRLRRRQRRADRRRRPASQHRRRRARAAAADAARWPKP